MTFGSDMNDHYAQPHIGGDVPFLKGVLKAIIDAVRTDVESGSSLADAMNRHPAAFDNLYCNMIAARVSARGAGREKERFPQCSATCHASQAWDPWEINSGPEPSFSRCRNMSTFYMLGF